MKRTSADICAAKAGFDTLRFPFDTPIVGTRVRDKRNGFSIPPQLTGSALSGPAG